MNLRLVCLLYHFKEYPLIIYFSQQIQDMLLRQPEHLKDTFTSRLRPPLVTTSNGLLNHDSFKHGIVPPLMQPPFKKIK